MSNSPSKTPIIAAVVALVVVLALAMFAMQGSKPQPATGDGETKSAKMDPSGNISEEDVMEDETTEDNADDIQPKSDGLADSRKQLLLALRKRFSEDQLQTIAEESVRIENEARQNHGETEAAYAAMAAGWAKLCKAKGMTEEERDALEDEAIRKEWLPPLTEDD